MKSPTTHNDHGISKYTISDQLTDEKALEIGQLVKDDYFTLFESIGAIEVPYFVVQVISAI